MAFWNQSSMDVYNSFNNEMLLEEALESDSLFSEMRMESKDVKSVLLKRENLEKMITFITEVPSPTDSENRVRKYPHVTTEIICFNSPFVATQFLRESNIDLFDKLFKFLGTPAARNPVLLGYFSRCMASIFSANPGVAAHRFRTYVTRHPESPSVRELLFSNLHHRSIVDLVVCLLCYSDASHEVIPTSGLGRLLGAIVAKAALDEEQALQKKQNGDILRLAERVSIVQANQTEGEDPVVGLKKALVSDDWLEVQTDDESDDETPEGFDPMTDGRALEMRGFALRLEIVDNVKTLVQDVVTHVFAALNEVDSSPLEAAAEELCSPEALYLVASAANCSSPGIASSAVKVLSFMHSYAQRRATDYLSELPPDLVAGGLYAIPSDGNYMEAVHRAVTAVAPWIASGRVAPPQWVEGEFNTAAEEAVEEIHELSVRRFPSIELSLDSDYDDKEEEEDDDEHASAFLSTLSAYKQAMGEPADDNAREIARLEELLEKADLRDGSSDEDDDGENDLLAHHLQSSSDEDNEDDDEADDTFLTAPSEEEDSEPLPEESSAVLQADPSHQRPPSSHGSEDSLDRALPELKLLGAAEMNESNSVGEEDVSLTEVAPQFQRDRPVLNIHAPPSTLPVIQPETVEDIESFDHHIHLSEKTPEELDGLLMSRVPPPSTVLPSGHVVHAILSEKPLEATGDNVDNLHVPVSVSLNGHSLLEAHELLGTLNSPQNLIRSPRNSLTALSPSMLPTNLLLPPAGSVRSFRSSNSASSSQGGSQRGTSLQQVGVIGGGPVGAALHRLVASSLKSSEGSVRSDDHSGEFFGASPPRSPKMSPSHRFVASPVASPMATPAAPPAILGHAAYPSPPRAGATVSGSSQQYPNQSSGGNNRLRVTNSSSSAGSSSSSSLHSPSHIKNKLTSPNRPVPSPHARQTSKNDELTMSPQQQAHDGEANFNFVAPPPLSLPSAAAGSASLMHAGQQLSEAAYERTPTQQNLDHAKTPLRNVGAETEVSSIADPAEPQTSLPSHLMMQTSTPSHHERRPLPCGLDLNFFPKELAYLQEEDPAFFARPVVDCPTHMRSRPNAFFMSSAPFLVDHLTKLLRRYAARAGVLTAYTLNETVRDPAEAESLRISMHAHATVRRATGVLLGAKDGEACDVTKQRVIPLPAGESFRLDLPSLPACLSYTSQGVVPSLPAQVSEALTLLGSMTRLTLPHLCTEFLEKGTIAVVLDLFMASGWSCHVPAACWSFLVDSISCERCQGACMSHTVKSGFLNRYAELLRVRKSASKWGRALEDDVEEDVMDKTRVNFANRLPLQAQLPGHLGSVTDYLLAIMRLANQTGEIDDGRAPLSAEAQSWVDYLSNTETDDGEIWAQCRDFVTQWHNNTTSFLVAPPASMMERMNQLANVGR